MQIIFEDKYRIAAAFIATITTSPLSPTARANLVVYPMAAPNTTQYVKVIAKRVIDPAADHERKEAGMSSGDDVVVISPASSHCRPRGSCG